MFVHETHSYFIMVAITEPEGASANYLEKKHEYIFKGITDTGGERVGNLKFTWMLNEVLFTSSEDVYKIIVKEISQAILADKSLSDDEKKAYAIDSHSEFDKIIVTEYIQDSTYIPK